MKSLFSSGKSSHLKGVAIAAALFFAVVPTHAEPARWKGEIDQLLKAEEANPPAPGGIVFIGSSSIKRWTSLKSDFPSLNVSNHGFGGSQLDDSLAYIDELVIARNPRVVVLYAGENDIASEKVSPEKVAETFNAFQQKLHAALPAAKLIFIGLKPSPSRAKHHEKFVETNALIAAACAKDFRCTFVDIGDFMVDPITLKTREELFVGDRLHMNAQGYAIWVKVLTPLLAP